MSVRFGLLGLIGQHPRHGYELLAAFTAMVGGGDNWDVKPAQIYTTLSRLKDAGWISEEGMEQDGGPEKRMYAITPDGRTALAEWLDEPVASTHRRDEFFIKLMIALYAGEDHVMRILYGQRRRLMQELHDITGQRRVLNPKTQLAHILLLDQAVMHTESDIRWLDMVEARFDDIRKQPLPVPEVKQRGRPRKNDS
jgi:DNA-binding PadR family transcriptional regulator